MSDIQKVTTDIHLRVNSIVHKLTEKEPNLRLREEIKWITLHIANAIKHLASINPAINEIDEESLTSLVHWIVKEYVYNVAKLNLYEELNMQFINEAQGRAKAMGLSNLATLNKQRAEMMKLLFDLVEKVFNLYILNKENAPKPVAKFEFNINFKKPEDIEPIDVDVIIPKEEEL